GLFFIPAVDKQGRPVISMAFAGTIDNVYDLLNALTAGVDLADWFKVEVNILPVIERRLFNGNTSMMFTMENGDIYTVILKDMGINITKKQWAHL
ncbi:hypothetical protein ACLBSJ_32565, partial [Klebsiella pneumoniae]|uniref:hypothetical protein n=1 Tax=Klebsiella pneumoniae TaxID=573 RepID=UPI003969A1AE